MPSHLAWLDTSENERRKALEVIDLFQQRDTRDELGIASIRDALSDLLSPGTSTIQTRTRYFFFVPWMYMHFERRSGPIADPALQLRQFETRLIAALSSSDDPVGTIGGEAGSSVKRLPSDVYWAGLLRLGIRRLPGSSERFLRALRDRTRVRESEGRDITLDESVSDRWHAHIPPAPAEFPYTADFKLRREEATYLQDRLQMHAGGSLLSYLAEAGVDADAASLPWDHPGIDAAPPALRVLVEHARCFSEVMHGASLLYNLILARLVPKDEWIEQYTDSISQWAGAIQERRDALRAWDPHELWSVCRRQNPRLPLGSVAFATSWIDLVRSADLHRLADHEGAIKLVSEREKRLKRDRSRIRSRSHLDRWSGHSGTRQLSYRWENTQTVLREIRAALQD